MAKCNTLKGECNSKNDMHLWATTCTSMNIQIMESWLLSVTAYIFNQFSTTIKLHISKNGLIRTEQQKEMNDFHRSKMCHNLTCKLIALRACVRVYEFKHFARASVTENNFPLFYNMKTDPTTLPHSKSKPFGKKEKPT